MFSQTVDYALRAVVYLADQAPSPRTTDQIAAATRVPEAYLSKVLQELGRAHIIHSRRGHGGGMVLAKSASELTILEVVNAVEPIRRIRECPLGLAAHGSRPARTETKDVGQASQALSRTEKAGEASRPNCRTADQ